VVKDYLFINGFVYLNDTLQYVMQEEGRIRYARKKNSTTGAIYYAFEYEYFIRDHLGNVRTVLTEGRDTSTYAATMESADSVVVRALFSNVYDPVNTVIAKPSGFDSDGANQKVSRLNALAGVNKKVGPSLVLKVMAGDKVQISTYAFYNSAVQPPPGGVDLTSELLSLLSSGVVNNSGGKVTSTTSASTALNPGVTSFLGGRPYDNTRPKAYLNWILFDNQFNYVTSNSGVQQAIAGSSKQALVAPSQTIAKNGYLYIYVSNESQQDVYFDDLNVKHYTGPLVQEQSYYPFGLQMAGISDKALNKLSSQYKFNSGVELEEDFGVNLYNTFFRQYDPQLGRFGGVDILSQQSHGLSPYQFGLNNPILFNDPLGDRAVAMGDIERMWNSPNGGHWNESTGVDLFDNQDEAFGFGMSYMNQFAAWGGGAGWAGSPDEAMGRYNGGNITPGIVQGFYQYQWAGTGRYNIGADYAPNGNGFNVSFSTDPTGTMDNAGVSYVSMDMMKTLLNGQGGSMLARVAPFALTAAAADGPILVGDALAAMVLAGAATWDITQRVYITYTLRNAAGQVYAGRASGYGNPIAIMMNRYSGHHMRAAGFGDPQLDKAVQGLWAYPAIRGREQQLIDSNGGIGDPNVGNIIRGVSKWNPAGSNYWMNSNIYFGNIAPFTGYF
jgi:RHS repeat-associated protein